MDKVEKVIHGKVVLKDDIFYIEKEDGQMMDFFLEGEGLRKLGLLWKLLKNGFMEPGSILFWDEPEAHMNPELFPLVCEILLGLADNGVQIFIATHNYNFAKYMEIRRRDSAMVSFHNLYWGNSLDYEGVEIQSGRQCILSDSAWCLEDLKSNSVMKADSDLLNEIFEDE